MAVEGRFPAGGSRRIGLTRRTAFGIGGKSRGPLGGGKGRDCSAAVTSLLSSRRG